MTNTLHRECSLLTDDIKYIAHILQKVGLMLVML